MSARTPKLQEPISIPDDREFQLNGQIFKGAVISVWRTWSRVASVPDAILGQKDPGGNRLTSVQLRLPGSGTGILLIAKATAKAGEKVGFHRADSAAVAIHEFGQRFHAGTVSWRDEKPFSGDDNGQVSSLPPLPPE